MSNRGREGVFVLSLYADHRSQRDHGELERMVVWPQGEVSVVQAVAVLMHLARTVDRVALGLLKSVQQLEECGALDEDCLSPVKPVGGKGLVFDASA